MARLIMSPATGERLLRFVGDRLRFTLRQDDGTPLPEGWRVLLRTQLGRAKLLRHEIISAHPRRPALANAAWHDVPMPCDGGEWTRELTLAESGFFRAKAYAIDPEGRQHWPEGEDCGVSVHPDQYRTNNTIYCAFIRMFGESKHATATVNPELEKQLGELDARGYSVIPPSGKIRDLIKELPFIMDTLGCRILHLLPVNPTPTTFARFGRFGSPYAAQDLTAVDPALVEFDQRTTGIDQFRELTYATHALGGRVFIDIVINHTGWGARLQETHPEWYLRDEKGDFVSPGAWGTVWEDLAELDHKSAALWEELAEMLLIWCRRGVDGFRCDAGYKVPLRAWRYITARVLEEFPETVFLLEGLGGSWEATENLITDGGMQWAYSELFQNYSGLDVASYLEYALRQSTRLGLYVHYSETHDNTRLAARGRDWSLLRNRLCALTSVSGGFGFTNGVEWLAAERVNVHSSRGLAWGSEPNIIPELAQLTELLRTHPCFYDGAKLTRVTTPESSVYALLRESADQTQRVVVAVNTDPERAQLAKFDPSLFCAGDVSPESFDPKLLVDLLGQKITLSPRTLDGGLAFEMPGAAVFCLSIGVHRTAATTAPLSEPIFYRPARARAAWAVTALSRVLPAENIGAFDWRVLADWVDRDPKTFLGALLHLDREAAARDLLAALLQAMGENTFPQVAAWELADRRRITLVPCNHWLLVRDNSPFRATLTVPGAPVEHVQSIAVQCGHVAFFAPRALEGSVDATLELERYTEVEPRVEAVVRLLECGDLSPPFPTATGRGGAGDKSPAREGGDKSPHSKIALLTNGRGGMARLAVDFGNITSKYDCLLGANLHATLPVDRHVFAKRARLWLVADGFATALNAENLTAFRGGPPAHWKFLASAGDGRAVEIEVSAEMVPQQNTTVLRFHRPARSVPFGADLPPEARVSLTVRVDIEDRSFHSETQRNDGAEHHFASHTRGIQRAASVSLVGGTERQRDAGGTLHETGFVFTPASDRQLRVVADAGRYHPAPEWCEGIPHPVEATRGQTGCGDAYSPGWFEIPLERGETTTLVVTAEPDATATEKISGSFSLETEAIRADKFHDSLLRAVEAFVVRRSEGKTIIAGYPWFLDWGRDSLICARGLIAGGMIEEVRDLLLTFARFEENGTLPNTIHGENASNRDTSDAALWFGVACEELAALECGDLSPPFPTATGRGGAGDQSPAREGGDKSPHSKFYRTTLDDGRTVADVLRSIAVHHLRGTPNGIRMDAESALIWSPSHFTWMDTNYPAGTPREGYPVEIQALWIRLLKQLHAMGARPEGEPWNELAARAEASLHELFWIEERGWFADVLAARSGVPAKQAERSDALRSNALFPISLGLVTGVRAQRCVEATARYLVVPGALRSLAPLPVSPPFAVYGNDGGLLNDPSHPYWPRYEGDEDTRRKPAYHNGTAWGWTFPSFCEALALAWDSEPSAVAAARTYLSSMRDLMRTGCAGHIAEVFDGDAPHAARGCDAQAWSATEALRVWVALQRASGS